MNECDIGNMCDLLLDLFRYKSKAIIDVEKALEDKKNCDKQGTPYSLNLLLKRVKSASYALFFDDDSIQLFFFSKKLSKSSSQNRAYEADFTPEKNKQNTKEQAKDKQITQFDKPVH